MNDGVVLEARGASRQFGGHEALAPTDLSLRRGERVALVGPNGAGKSTLLALLAGGLEPSGGTIERAPGLQVGWAPQRPAHYGRLSARENLELFARLGGEADPAGSSERMLARFDLPRGRQASAALSVGNRQRLDLALALLGRPDVLLLDEPTASLDSAARARLWADAAAFTASGGAVVFATQSAEDVRAVADRVVALDAGAVVYAGPAAGHAVA